MILLSVNRILAGLVSLLLFPVVVMAEPVWRSDFDEAVTEGVRNYKPVILFFLNTKWSPSSRVLRQTLFSSSEFDEYAKKCVLMEIDCTPGVSLPVGRKDTNDKLVRRFGVRTFPTVVIVDAKDETPYGLFWGYDYPAKLFVEYLSAPKSDPKSKVFYRMLIEAHISKASTKEGRFSAEKMQLEDILRWSARLGFENELNNARQLRDLEAVEVVLGKIFGDFSGPATAMRPVWKAEALFKIDSSAGKQVQLLLDEARVLAGDNPEISRYIDNFQERVRRSTATSK